MGERCRRGIARALGRGADQGSEGADELVGWAGWGEDLEVARGRRGFALDAGRGDDGRLLAPKAREAVHGGFVAQRWCADGMPAGAVMGQAMGKGGAAAQEGCWQMVIIPNGCCVACRSSDVDLREAGGVVR